MAVAGFHPLTVAAVEPLTDDAAAIIFDVPAPLREAFAFQPASRSPSGTFTPGPSSAAGRHVLVAAGSVITPVLSIA